MPAPKPPAADIRIGPVRAAIWDNQTQDGQPFHTVTFSRLYKNDDGEWRDTPSFRTRDLLPLAKLADRAHSKILQLKEEARGAGEEETDAES
ncbi:MAG: hypothetical protein OXN18_15485 [Gemmatimonadota bacterium]|nr:hypothetical protein [Gemmatimonadota bacterium]